MKLSSVSVAFVLAALSAGVQAADKAPGTGPNPYSDCGIGAAIFQDTAWAAATSNVIWDLGITAITSAVSSPETCNAKKVETARLILETLPSLEQDIAVGEGVHLAALNATLGCDAAAGVNAKLRVAYADVVTAEGYADGTRIDRASGLYDTVRAAVDASPGACTATL